MRSESRGSMPSTPMTMTFLPALRETRLPRPEPVIAHAQPRGADGRRRPPNPPAQSAGSLPADAIGHRTDLGQGVFASDLGTSRRASPTDQRLAVHVVGDRHAEHCQHGRADVDQARVFVSTVGCRTGCRARATGRRSGRRSTLSCSRGRRPPSSADRRLPRNAVAPLVADDQVGAIVLIRPLVELRGDIDALDGARLRFLDRPARSRAGDLLAEPVGLAARLDDPCATYP